MILSFRPQLYDESETDQILNAKYFVGKNYTLRKWGLREAFNQNSLMQLFNGDRRIVLDHFTDHFIDRFTATVTIKTTKEVKIYHNEELDFRHNSKMLKKREISRTYSFSGFKDLTSPKALIDRPDDASQQPKQFIQQQHH